MLEGRKRRRIKEKMDSEKPYHHHRRDPHHHYQQQPSPFCHCCNAMPATTVSNNSCATEMKRSCTSSYYSFSSRRTYQKIGLLSILCLVLIVPDTSATVVQTKIGKIRGLEEETPASTKYYAFKGIRYASSPTKELRFQVIISLTVKIWYWLKPLSSPVLVQIVVFDNDHYIWISQLLIPINTNGVFQMIALPVSVICQHLQVLIVPNSH